MMSVTRTVARQVSCFGMTTCQLKKMAKGFKGMHEKHKIAGWLINNNRDFKIQGRGGTDNVALKVNLRSFSLYRNYFYPLTLSNVGEPSWS